MLEVIRKKKGVRDRIQTLKNSISNSSVYSPRDVTKFIFLCGANKDENSISERRKSLIKFSKQHLPHAQFFLAEKMFSTLQKEEHKGNLLDIETEISQFADHIVIVLESPSSFAELGAFSHKLLRNKLIIINDKRFEKSNSFVNLGPLKAVKEAAGDESVIYYKMNDDGVFRLDAIGDTFDHLHGILKDPIKGKSRPISLDACDPSSNFNKASAMLVHDLIYFTGPITHKELVEVVKIIFGNKNFKLKEHVAILGAFESVSRDDIGLYRSNMRSPYYEYRFDINKLISTFRNHLMKSYPERIYGN